MFAPSWFVPSPKADHPLNTPLGPSTARLWSYLMGARVFVACGLLALQLLAWLQGQSSTWLLAVCGGYLMATTAVLRWSRPSRSESVWSAGWALTLWVDLTVFGLLQNFQQGSFNFTPLFMLPVLLASILGPFILAMGSAAFATLMVLLDAFTSEVFRVGQTTYVQAAITSVGLFLVALLAHQLAARLGREQAQARLSRAQAVAESQVNQLIVTGLSEGVLVVDAHGRIWHANPAACAMLGAPQAQPPYTTLMTLPGWPPLADWARDTLQVGQDDRCELSLPKPTGGPQHLLLRARVTPASDHAEATACVIFLEDLRDVETRVRNEKLAAMGRVSAAVAHEIRNPLAAIAQANALLAEESLSPIQHKLTHMIGQNAKRLGRTVDDILDVAKLPASPSALDQHTPLDDTIGTALAEWHAQQPGTPPPQWQPGAAGLAVRFDAEHLRRVLVNLLDNAHKYGTGGMGAIEVDTTATGELMVWNPGPPLRASVAQHLFEPFASSHSRSSGLGLYLSRELCERYGAQLAYQPSSRHGVAGHGFVVSMQRH